MSLPIDWQYIQSALQHVLASPVQLEKLMAVSGGDIHQSYRLFLENETADGIAKELPSSLFIKLNRRSASPILQAEKHSLQVLYSHPAIVSPKPLLCDMTEHHSFLVMEYFPLSYDGDEYLLGQQLAQLHQQTQRIVDHEQNRYGFEYDNFIGLTPQSNTWTSCWSTFWIEQRLKPQLTLAYRNGFAPSLKPQESVFLEAVKQLLNGYMPPAVLLHGDLWNGNKGFVKQQPVIFDPACYYGDRETDLAMTELFGGFSADFYRGYNDVWPLDSGYSQRKNLYNLYHKLNHLNLFGSAYLAQVERGIAHISSLAF